MITIDNEFKLKIGERIKALRKQQGLTINNVVDKLNNSQYINIDEKTIRRYEKGEFIPKIDNLIAFCDLFQTSLDFLIFGKETSDDNSFTLKDNLKRLNRLIYSCMLFPYRDNDENSLYFDKYYFMGFDEELKIYIERLINFAKTKNNSFEVYNRNPIFNIHDWDNLIQDFNEYNEQLSPSEKRLNDIITKTGGDPQIFLKDKINEILHKRHK